MNTSPTNPSPSQPEVYIPGYLIPKILYVVLGCLIFAVGFGYIWEPLGRCLYGRIADATVVRIVKVQPGVADVSYTFRQDFAEERDPVVVFEHYVTVSQQGRKTVLQIGIDSHRQPNYNINDRVHVCYYPGETIAFDVWNARSWGIGILVATIGLITIISGLFLVVNANRPIVLDHESEEFTKAMDEGHPPPAPEKSTPD